MIKEGTFIFTQGDVDYNFDYLQGRNYIYMHTNLVNRMHYTSVEYISAMFQPMWF